MIQVYHYNYCVYKLYETHVEAVDKKWTFQFENLHEAISFHYGKLIFTESFILVQRVSKEIHHKLYNDNETEEKEKQILTRYTNDEWSLSFDFYFLNHETGKVILTDYDDYFQIAIALGPHCVLFFNYSFAAAICGNDSSPFFLDLWMENQIYTSEYHQHNFAVVMNSVMYYFMQQQQEEELQIELYKRVLRVLFKLFYYINSHI